jgi:hypothetical protein
MKHFSFHEKHKIDDSLDGCGNGNSGFLNFEIILYSKNGANYTK